jgi:hypothetical protein
MNQKLELFAIVELFGHGRMAGKVTEQSIGPDTFIRVSVPETKNQPSFDRLLNPKAIYAINPVTEEVMQAKAEQLQTSPIEAWDIRKMQEKLLELGAGTKGHEEREEEEEEEDEFQNN